MSNRSSYRKIPHITQKINRQDFRDWLNQASASARMLTSILAWLIGLAYLLVGAFFWREWMAQYDLKIQAFWMLPVFAAGPALLGFAALFNRIVGNWPRCPTCGKKIHALLPTLASKRCPHCHALILEDTRELSPGYLLPLTMEESLEKKPGYTLSVDTEFLRKVRIILVTPPLMIALFLAFGLNHDMELELMMAAIVQIMGIAIIGMVGLPSLISISWMTHVCRFLQLIPKEQFIYCPECGCIPSASIARRTGCCSECGAKLLELANEPDTPDMLDWHAVKRYETGKSRSAIIAAVLYPVFLLGSLLKCWRLLWALGAIYAITIWQDFRLKKLARIPKKCPHCSRQLAQSAIRSLLNYGRCPRCNHKLVRDGDAER